MPGNVLTWDQAVRQGYGMSHFSYQPADVPLGTVEAELCFKIWAQKIMGINCYFLERESQKRFVLTVYCTHRGYCLTGSDIDFSRSPTGVSYQLKIAMGSTGKIALLRAVVIS
jgi:hypothetical protein